ncbi:uncharacterized protein DUF1761 [Hoeflea marina]|uniref:Uncharacterized protein DUF1761 n=1 Tax=Hoeflea marina TaxID=274592 RepID=A0A317PGJ1_9HYPH|nr:DUF1761 domain-containing protein [Hoeflea marina]PWV98252.1 uncharacterized protein DUF1761 [Hoeflea marina]
MQFAGLNWLAIPVAAICAFIIGAVYYGAMAKHWMKAAKITGTGEKMMPSPVLLINSLVMELVLATMTAGVIGHLGPGQVTAVNGVISGFFLWLGFIVPTISINQRYQGFGWDLTLIDSLHWLLVMLAIGGVVGLFGA